jgi:rare lipoprotein A
MKPSAWTESKTLLHTVKGKTYYPMTVAAARSYSEEDIASCYGWKTRHQEGGHMTANGEAFNPRGLTAAHKYLPISYVKVTNLENERSLIARVNDCGPFPSDHNPASGRRIIDLSMGAAQKLGFYRQGITRVLVESIQTEPTRLAEME